MSTDSREIESALLSDSAAAEQAERMNGIARAERIAQHGEALIRDAENFIRRFVIVPVGVPLVEPTLTLAEIWLP